jgi:hypothetical protein
MSYYFLETNLFFLRNELSVIIRNIYYGQIMSYYGNSFLKLHIHFFLETNAFFLRNEYARIQANFNE